MSTTPLVDMEFLTFYLPSDALQTPHAPPTGYNTFGVTPRIRAEPLR